MTSQLETLFDSVSGGKSGGSSVASCVSLEQKLEAVKGFRGVEERGRALQGAAAKVVAALQNVVRAGDVSATLRTCNVNFHQRVDYLAEISDAFHRCAQGGPSPAASQTV